MPLTVHCYPKQLGNFQGFGRLFLLEAEEIKEGNRYLSGLSLFSRKKQDHCPVSINTGGVKYLFQPSFHSATCPLNITVNFIPGSRSVLPAGSNSSFFLCRGTFYAGYRGVPPSLSLP